MHMYQKILKYLLSNQSRKKSNGTIFLKLLYMSTVQYVPFQSRPPKNGQFTPNNQGTLTHYKLITHTNKQQTKTRKHPFGLTDSQHL